jgi:hypothetical protein
LNNTKSESIGERLRTGNKMICYVIHGLPTRYTIPEGCFFRSTLTTAQFSILTLKMLKLSTDRGFIVLRLASNAGLFKNLCSGTLIVICISRPRNQSLTYLEKNCRRDRLRQRQTISRMLKDFAATTTTTQHFLRNRKFVIITK